MELLKAKLPKPTNAKIGKVLAEILQKDKPFNESTVRSWIKNDPELFKERLVQYRMEKSPFIPYKDYKKLSLHDSISKDNILKGKVPGILSTEDKVLCPTNLNDIINNVNEIKKFNQCDVISISNFKGGVGKTTSALNLAVTLSFYGLNVLVTDFDIQGNTTAMFDLYRYKKDETKIDLTINDLDELYDSSKSDFKSTIVDLIAEVENDDIESIIKDSIVNLNDRVQTIGKLDIIPNASNIENALKFEDIDKTLRTYGNVNQALDEVLSYVKKDYDFIIIDTPPSISLPLRMSVLATDYFCIALVPDKMSKDGINPFIVPIEMNSKAYKRHKKKDIVILGGILNQFQNNINIQKMNKELIEEDLTSTVENSQLGESSLFKQSIKVDNIIKEAQTHLGCVLLYNPTSELVRDYFNLADEILEKIIIDKYSKLN